MENIRYNLIFKPEPEGGFTVIVPSLPGCVTYGKTLEQARKYALEAIEVYLESLKKHQELILSDDASFISTVSLKKIPNKAMAIIREAGLSTKDLIK